MQGRCLDEIEFSLIDWSICVELYSMKCLTSQLARVLIFGLPGRFFGFFKMFSGVVTEFGRPLRCSSWRSVRPRLSSVTQNFIVEYEGEESPNVGSNSDFISLGLNPFK